MQQSTPPPTPRRPRASADTPASPTPASPAPASPTPASPASTACGPASFTPAGVPRRSGIDAPRHLRHRFHLGLPAHLVLLLAAFAIPRVVLHDLGLVADGGVVDALLTTIPFAVWIIVAVARRTPSPLLTLVIVGGVYGALEAVAHLVLWGIASAAGLPHLDVVLAGEVHPVAMQIVVRVATAFGSVVSGVVVGAVAGSVAWVVARAAHNPRP